MSYLYCRQRFLALLSAGQLLVTHWSHHQPLEWRSSRCWMLSIAYLAITSVWDAVGWVSAFDVLSYCSFIVSHYLFLFYDITFVLWIQNSI
jgi:hypothetical protein